MHPMDISTDAIVAGTATIASAVAAWLASKHRYSGQAKNSDAQILWDAMTAELSRKDSRISILEERLDTEIKSWSIQRKELYQQLAQSEARERECLKTSAKNNIQLEIVQTQLDYLKMRLENANIPSD